MQHFLFVALGLALSVQQQSGAGAPPPASAPQAVATQKALATQSELQSKLVGRWQQLVDLTRPTPGPLGLAVRVPPADVFAEMAALADGGLGMARAWCARHLDAAPAESSSATAAASEHFVRLVLEHGGEPWLLDPALDPLTSLERASEPVRQAVEAALAPLDGQLGAGRDLALALRAVAVAPRSEPDNARRARALALLAEVAQAHPATPWQARAERLSWRIARLSPGQEAPELAVIDVDGNQLELALLRGRPVLIDAWSTRDADLLQRVRARRALLERFPTGRIAVFGIGRGAEDPLAFRRLLEELDLPWPTAFERAGAVPLASAWPLDEGPLSVLIDECGVVRAVGLEGAELELAVEQMLAAPHSGAAAPRVDPGQRGAGRATDR